MSTNNVPDEGHVYIIEKRGVIKIGQSRKDCLDRRLKQLKPDRILGVTPPRADYKQLETSLHREYKQHRLPQSEWFEGLAGWQVTLLMEKIGARFYYMTDHAAVKETLNTVSPMRAARLHVKQSLAENWCAGLQSELSVLLMSPWIQGIEVEVDESDPTGTPPGYKGIEAIIKFVHPSFPLDDSYLNFDARVLMSYAEGSEEADGWAEYQTLSTTGTHDYGDPVPTTLRAAMGWLWSLAALVPAYIPPAVARKEAYLQALSSATGFPLENPDFELRDLEFLAESRGALEQAEAAAALPAIQLRSVIKRNERFAA